MVGTKVEELQRQLAEARDAVEAGEAALKRAGDALRGAGETRAVANQQAETAAGVWRERGEARAQAIAKLQRFAGTGLLLAALPRAELPDMASPWTIDPALTLARRAEQELSNLKDDDEAWARVQRQITPNCRAVAICQLQWREGIDAVFVSRWSWDGREKTSESDPDRRFAPA